MGAGILPSSSESPVYLKYKYRQVTTPLHRPWYTELSELTLEHLRYTVAATHNLLAKSNPIARIIVYEGGRERKNFLKTDLVYRQPLFNSWSSKIIYIR